MSAIGITLDTTNCCIGIFYNKKEETMANEHDQNTTTEELNPINFNRVQEMAENYLGKPMNDAVITVPAKFSETQQQATKKSAALAGLNVLDLLKEPTAAALAYGFKMQPKNECNALILILNDEACEATVVNMHEGLVNKLKATVGDNNLSGKNFNNLLEKYLIHEFEVRHKKNICLDPVTLHKLQAAAEQAKCDLSMYTEAVISIEDFFEGNKYATIICRQHFEDLCADIFENIIKLVQKALNVAEMSEAQIEHIILVDGLARLPKLRNLLQTFFSGKILNLSSSAAEMLAYGAAIQAAILNGVKAHQIQEVLVVEHTNITAGSTNLIILACKENKPKILAYLLARAKNISPKDVDKTCHNAFYYAIRACNVELIDILISKWPANYFDQHAEELDEILAQAYEQLKLLNVPLTAEIEFYVENKLIELRFYARATTQNENITISTIKNLKDRIDLVIKSINTLTAVSASTVQVDEQFLFIAKFIAQNINILKQQLAASYERLPWEELEFCLVRFIASKEKLHELNLFYSTIITKSKLLNYLKYFAEKLAAEKNIIEVLKIQNFSIKPQIERSQVTANIISNNPTFQELYADYQQTRDMHSLQKIAACLKLCATADAKEKAGQLVITRALQVIGEYFKNSLDSPKLSSVTIEQLLYTLPKNTRNIIMDLRDSFSHAYTLSKRLRLEANTSIQFFIDIQEELQTIADVINEIIFSYKIKTIRLLLKQIIASTSAEEIAELAELFAHIEYDPHEMQGFDVMEHVRLERLLIKFHDIITEKTAAEEAEFNAIEKIIDLTNTKCIKVMLDYYAALDLLMALNLSKTLYKTYSIERLKDPYCKILQLLSEKIEIIELQKIAEHLFNIFQSINLRLEEHILAEVRELLFSMFLIINTGIGYLKWIESLSNKLPKQQKFYPKLNAAEYKKQLQRKLCELQSIMQENNLVKDLFQALLYYKENSMLQATIEMLILDIMSILNESEKCLEKNFRFLDDSIPLLIGKSLRNHLAHDNIILDVIPHDFTVAVIANAKQLIAANFASSGNMKIGKLMFDDISKLSAKYERSLVTISNKNKMFAALEAGKLAAVKQYISEGVDIHARNTEALTVLHFAARAPNLEAVVYMLEQEVDVHKLDINGQSALHAAAANGRQDIVEFLIKNAGLTVDHTDATGKTPLHLAAESGHTETVRVLLQNKAKTDITDSENFWPVHYAVCNNHIAVVKLLLEKEKNVDIIDTLGGNTCLHLAAEFGHLDLVAYLIEHGAKVHATTYQGYIPLHKAAYLGHLEVVKALIKKESNVNFKDLLGCTSLHWALRGGHEEIAYILLKHGANIHATAEAAKYSALHYAAMKGYEKIVKTLLDEGANANATTVQGATPLHLAVEHKQLNIVTALLQYGVTINAGDENKATPLHKASVCGGGGGKEIVAILLKNNANINASDINKQTPLHMAALSGYKDICELLIEQQANVTAKDANDATPLQLAALNGSLETIELLIKHNSVANDKTANLTAAVKCGKKDVVELLISNYGQLTDKDNDLLNIAIKSGNEEIVAVLLENKANANVKCEGEWPLITAIQHNLKAIVEVLLAYNAEVNVDNGKPLTLAVRAGFTDIVKILLENNACIDMSTHNNNKTLLHLAAENGHKEIASLLLNAGATIVAMPLTNKTPLHFAVHEGHDQVAALLIKHGANVNATDNVGPPLNVAAALGHIDVVEVLLRNKANAFAVDTKNRTAVEQAVSNGQLEIVKMLKNKKILKKSHVDARNEEEGWTLLHFACQSTNLQMVEYFFNEAYNINVTTNKGAKPIHIAAINGLFDAIELLLNKGQSINERGESNYTLLHYAAMKGQLEVVKYLIAKGADVDAKDIFGNTPLHLAAMHGFRDAGAVLLESGAILNELNQNALTPLDNAKMYNKSEILSLLETTAQLFDFSQENSNANIEAAIRAGAIINAKCADSQKTPLHVAILHGSEQAANVLLQNGANPNAIDCEKFTLLHCAAAYSQFEIVKALLRYGAVYNAVSSRGQTPCDLTHNADIIQLLKKIANFFEKVKNRDVQLIAELQSIKDMNTLKSVLNARNNENSTLIVAAIHNDFPQLKQLKEISQTDICAQVRQGTELFKSGSYKRALAAYKSAFEKRKALLGADSPGTLEIQVHIAEVLCDQGNSENALQMLAEIFEKQEKILGSNHVDTLKTKCNIAIVLFKQRQNEMAYKTIKEVYQAQNSILGPNNDDVLNTRLNMATILLALKRYEEALAINTSIFNVWQETKGISHADTLFIQDNLAGTLSLQGKFEEAIEMYKSVLFESRKFCFGMHNIHTLRTLHSIALTYYKQSRYHEALSTFREVLSAQKQMFNFNHPEILSTQFFIAKTLFAQRKYISALSAFNECFDQIKVVFGESHHCVKEIERYFFMIKRMLKIEDIEISQVLQHIQDNNSIAAAPVRPALNISSHQAGTGYVITIDYSLRE